MAADFCSRNSFDKPPSIPRDTGGIGATGGVSSGGRANSASVEQMTEEEQLQAAIRASMNEASEKNQSGGKNDDDDDQDMSDENDVYIMEDSGDDDDDDDERDTTMDMGDDEELNEDTVKELTFHDEIVSMDVGEEPSGNNGSRIMIRMPDGKRLVRKFNVEDTVKIVYAFVAVSLFFFTTYLFVIYRSVANCSFKILVRNVSSITAIK